MAKSKVVSFEDLAALKERLEQASSAPTDSGQATTVTNVTEEVNLDELDIEAALASIMHTRTSLQEAGSVDDEELKAAVARKENARIQLPQLYEARTDLNARLKNLRPQIKIATQHNLAEKVAFLSGQIGEAEKALTYANRLIKAIEDRYPDVASEIAGSQSRMSFVRGALARFAQNEAGQYTASGTVNPAPATIAETTAFLTGLIEKISTGERAFMRPRQDSETALVVTAKGSWVSMYPEILEISELGVALTRYRMAIETADRQRLELWAAGLVEAGYLLSSKMAQAMKETGTEGLRRNVLDLVDAGSGYFFMPVRINNLRCNVTSYQEVRNPQMLVRVFPGSIAAHVMRFDRVTAPQAVEEIFGKEGATRHKVTVPFNTVAELLDPKGSVGKRIPENLRKALVSAHNFAQRQRQEQADLAQIRNVSGLENLITIEEMGHENTGTAVVSVSEYSEEDESYRTYPLAMRVVSDGNVARPGLATSRSKEGWLYKALLKDDVKVTEFFARVQDGTFSNAKLQDVAVRNEGFEVDWLVARAAGTHNAELISAKNGNVSALCLTVADGGRDGTFVVTVPVHDRNPGGAPRDRRQTRDKGREAAYVVTRSGDTIMFVAGLTGYSRTKLETSGCKFNEPYAIELLADYPRYVLRTVFCVVTKTEREKAPTHLLRTSTKPVTVTAVPSEATPVPQVDEPVGEPMEELYGDVLDVAESGYVEDDSADETDA